jgi:DNA-binding MarR family transcriptional regulator
LEGTMIDSLKKYFSDILGQELNVSSWKGSKALPLYLRDKYKFLLCSPEKMQEKKFLGVKATNGFDPTPAEIKKNFEVIVSKLQIPCVLISDRIVSYDRKRLIEHKVPFIVIENQMYLPFMAIDLREFFKGSYDKSKKIVPSVQAVILNVLHKQKSGGKTSEFAEDLKYSKMTVHRAFDVIESLGLGIVKKIDRERYLEFNNRGKKLWQEVKDMLKPRIKKKVIVEKIENDTMNMFLISGISALSIKTMINPPVNPVYAIGFEDLKYLENNNKIKVIPHHNDDSIEIEVFKYNPRLFAQKGLIDDLTLYLSLKDTTDERIKIALDEIMEDFKW